MQSQYVDSIAFSDIACILVVFVGIWSFCNSIIPRNGCRRLAKSTHFGAENHTVSVILQVAQQTGFPKASGLWRVQGRALALFAWTDDQQLLMLRLDNECYLTV